MACIAVKDLEFSYPEASAPVLSGISLEIEQGEFAVLFGKTGCGKTTLLRHFKTTLTPHGQRSGQVLFNNLPLDETDARIQAERIGFVMQNPDAQIVTDKVWHELAFGLENIGVAQDAMRLRVAEIASYFGIESWFHRNVTDLSGGQKQLLALASVLAMRPDVIVLDEPTSQLDPISAADFLATVRKVNTEFGTTIILSEHRLEDVYVLADKVFALEDGRIAAAGNPRDVAFQLLESGNELAYALPSAARIWYGTPGHKKVANTVPLSIQEGRMWLINKTSSIAASSTLNTASRPNCVHEENSRQGSETSSDAHAFPEQEVVVDAQDLWFRYERNGHDVLCGTSFAIHKGETFAFVGGNGAGKSTVLKSICSVLKPQRGVLRVFGKKLSQWQQSQLFNGCLAMLSQDPTSLFAKKTVREELEEMCNLEAQEAAESIKHVIGFCGLERLLDMHPLDLSGGEAQRVALAKVLLCKPRILLLDEPTKGIDAAYKRELAALFDQLKAQGCTIVLASHDLEFCARYADTVALLFDGQISVADTPQHFFCEANYYTTAANRMCRRVCPSVVTEEDAVRL